MRLLFHNYSDDLSTEPIYLTQALKQCGIDAHLWNDPKISAFDVMDMVKPDILITSRNIITNDIIKYLRKHPTIDLVMNVTGITDNQAETMITTMKNTGIRIPFVFTNHFGYRSAHTQNVPCHRIYPAADLFGMHPKLAPILPELIISNKFSPEVEKYIADKDVYHLLYMSSGDLIQPFDTRGNVRSVARMYCYYDKVTIFGDADFCLSQILFDGMLMANDMQIKSENTEDFQTGLQDAFSDITDTGEDVVTQWKKIVKSKHTPFHRAWTLMKHLKNKDAMEAINRVKGQLGTMLKDV